MAFASSFVGNGLKRQKGSVCLDQCVDRVRKPARVNMGLFDMFGNKEAADWTFEVSEGLALSFFFLRGEGLSKR